MQSHQRSGVEYDEETEEERKIWIEPTDHAIFLQD
jgi:hypothetical protein